MIDYLLIDMPRNIRYNFNSMQSFPIDELIVVSTPQDMVSMMLKSKYGKRDECSNKRL